MEEKKEIVWYPVTPDTVDFYGMDAEFRRMPDAAAAAVSPAVRRVARNTAGGRIRFATNSTRIQLRTQMATAEYIGFDLYRLEDGHEICMGGFRGLDPSHIFMQRGEFICELFVNGYLKKRPGVQQYTLNFPYNAHPFAVEIGIEEGCVLEHGAPYRNEKPVVFYGSSIVNGGWATRPGMTYEAQISQKLNLDYVNLGFSGVALGEPAMADYIAGLPMSAFVLDYDHNAPNAEHLAATHEPFYKTVRAAHPDIPVIMVTKPDFDANAEKNEARAAVIRATFEAARARGENVYMIEGKTIFNGDSYHNCMRDGCHPTDLGFYRMANVIGPVIAKALGIEWPAVYDYLAY